MTTKKQSPSDSADRSSKRNTARIVIVNTIIIAIMAVSLFIYFETNRIGSRELAIDALSNTTDNLTDTLSVYMIAQQDRTSSLATVLTRYCASIDDAAGILEDAENSNIQYELIDCEKRTGLAFVDGETIEVNYTNYTYDKLLTAFYADNTGGLVDTTPEFTDSVTKLKSVAFFSHVKLAADNRDYVLFGVTRTNDLISSNISLPEYTDSYAAIVNSAGEYIVKTNGYKNSGIYEYLAGYNSLSVLEKESLRNIVRYNGKGYLEYLNYEYQPCIYAYKSIPGTNNWYFFAQVPVSSLEAGVRGYDIMVIIMIFALVLASSNIIVIAGLNSKLRQSLNATIIEARNAEKASLAKSEFLSRMSHDMRTPMNGIIGIADLALADNVPYDELRSYMKQVQSSGQFLLSLINDTLDLKKIESDKMELNPMPIKLSELCQLANSVIKPRSDSKNISLSITCGEPDSAAIMADRLRLNQIITNILNNSVKFTPSGGSVSLKITATYTSDAKDRKRCVMVFSDTGIGMSKEFQKRMFEPFECENPNAESTGLGLAIVKNLVTLMKGDITCVSALNNGTIITITFNFELAPEVHESLKSGSDNLKVLEGKTILLAEDNDINAMISMKLLEAKGMKVERAENGQIALDMFADSEQGKYAAILMDIRMPVMDGMTATREIRALDRDDARTIPIAAMTANAFEEDAKNSLDAGMNAHIPKPVEPQYLYKTLAGLISGV